MPLSTLLRAALERFKLKVQAAWPGRILEMRVFGSVARGKRTKDPTSMSS